MPRLSVIIVTYNSRAELDRCLASLIVTPASVDHEVVVVDNASSDDTAARVRDHWPGVRVIEAGANVGFARGNNIGIRATTSELVLLLNPDTRTTPQALDALVAALDADPQAAVAGPRLVDDEGRAELSFGTMIAPLAELRQKILVRGHARGVPLLSWWVERRTRRGRYVDWVSGACLLIRRADLDAAGLLDERFFMYTEDVDLCAAVRARGRRVLFAPGAQVTHTRGQSRATAKEATEVAYRRSHVAFYEKHHPRWAPVLKAYLRLRGQWPKGD
jgi:GT2 family glycosyltransferase